jgi:Domain of unknown function (DUF3463).
MTVQKFRKIENWMNRYAFFGTPVYLNFCWQTRPDLFGLGNSHAKHPWLEGSLLFDDRRPFLDLRGAAGTDDWNRYGVVNGVARDSRCENCMVHCGYEPTATLGLQAQRGDTWKTIKFNFGAKPKAAGRGSEVLAYNGVSSGNGHLPASALSQPMKAS